MKKRYDLLAFIWAIIILILCGIPGKKIPELTFIQWLGPDKIVHLILFGTQCFLLLKAFHLHTNVSFKKAAWISVTFSISYGILVEILQKYIFIDRSPDVRDAMANAVGAFCGLWLFRFLEKRKTTS